MATMQAYRMVGWGKPAEYQEVPVPEPAPGQVLIKMAGAGLCGSDLHILHSPPGLWPKEPPFTLGHENAGWVVAVGPGVRHFGAGDGVVVSGVNFCGSCDRCVGGMQNECRNMLMAGYGSGDDGGLAEFMIAEARHLVPLGGLDPVVAAPLSDAGATSYHAVKRQQERLMPGTTAAVIGAGGLGIYAVQYLKHLTGARVIAVDTEQHRLDNAFRLGADAILIADAQTPSPVPQAAGGPVDVVFDFVGTTPTLAAAVAAIGTGGRVVVVGIGGGEIPFGWANMPMNSHFINSMGFTPGDLLDVIAMTRAGDLEVASTRYTFSDIETGLRDLGDATVEGRAVITFA